MFINRHFTRMNASSLLLSSPAQPHHHQHPRHKYAQSDINSQAVHICDLSQGLRARPSVMSKPNSSSSNTQGASGGKQATLFGFFKKQIPKNEAAAAASTARQTPRIPVTPETSVSSNAGSSSADRLNGNAAASSKGATAGAASRVPRGNASMRSASSAAPIDLDLDQVDEDDEDESEVSATTPSTKKQTNGLSGLLKKAAPSARTVPTPPLTSENEDTNASSSAMGSEMDVEEAAPEDEDDEDEKPAPRLVRCLNRASAGHTDKEIGNR